MTNMRSGLLILLVCAAPGWAQTNIALPGWFEGNPLTEASLSGIWWIKIPFEMETQNNKIEVVKQETILSARYVIFGENRIVYRSTLSHKEPVSAVGVWLLQEGKLFISISSINLELTYYMVRDDSILVSGIAEMGDNKSMVAGVLNRVQGGRPKQLMEE